VLPLYQAVIKRLDEFKELFLSSDYNLTGRGGTDVKDINQLAENWKNEAFLKSNTTFYFSYWLRGFKAAGNDAFDCSIQLSFEKDSYHYSFSLLTHTGHQTNCIKKLYHQQLDDEDIVAITELIEHLLLDDIEARMDNLKVL
jgi:hypothetical protein